MNISGDYYPISKQAQFISYIIYAIQVLICYLIVFKEHSRNTLTFLPAKVFEFFENKSPISCFLVYFIGNGLVNSISNTGAFEVLVDNKLIFSKLQSGRMPHVDEVMSLIKKAATLIGH